MPLTLIKRWPAASDYIGIHPERFAGADGRPRDGGGRRCPARPFGPNAGLRAARERSMVRQQTRQRIRRWAAVLAFAGMGAITVDAHAQSSERGRQLYENHCQVCHTPQIHGRPKRMAMTVDELREIVRRWQENQGLRWSREEIEDVTQYLATTKYRFSTSIDRPGAGVQSPERALAGRGLPG